MCVCVRCVLYMMLRGFISRNKPWGVRRSVMSNKCGVWYIVQYKYSVQQLRFVYEWGALYSEYMEQ